MVLFVALQRGLIDICDISIVRSLEKTCCVFSELLQVQARNTEPSCLKGYLSWFFSVWKAKIVWSALGKKTNMLKCTCYLLACNTSEHGLFCHQAFSATRFRLRQRQDSFWQERTKEHSFPPLFPFSRE